MKMMDPAPVEYNTLGNGEQYPFAGTGNNISKSRNTRVSLKQWRMFHAVIEFNGFVGAAEKLHISQSSISHALSKLQEQLGVTLLTLKGRKSHVTEEGLILLERSRHLVQHAVELEELAENLRQGWGPELRLAVDPNFPSHLLMHALQKLSPSLRKIRLSVQEMNAEQASEALHEDAVDFAIAAKMAMGFVSRELIGIEYVAVAHPDNPLFALKREVGFDDLKTQCEVAVSSCNDYVAPEADQPLPRSPRPWNVSSLDRAIATLGQGLGYAWLPRYRLQQLLDENHLRLLPLNSGARRTINLYLIFGRAVSESPCATRFAEALRSSGAGII